MPPRVKLANEVKEKYMAQYDDRKNLHKNRHKVFFCLPTCLAKPLWEKPFLSKYDFTTRTSGKKKKREEDKNREREREGESTRRKQQHKFCISKMFPLSHIVYKCHIVVARPRTPVPVQEKALCLPCTQFQCQCLLLKLA